MTQICPSQTGGWFSGAGLIAAYGDQSRRTTPLQHKQKIL
jgi:hypothetical protein